MAYLATVACAECETEFEARSPRAKYCKAKCRKAANRRPAREGAAQGSRGIPAPGGLVGQVAADLEKAKALDTIPGRAALALAYRIESPMETGSAAAQMTKELSRLVEEAVALAPKQADGTDALTERVNAKLRLVR